MTFDELRHALARGLVIPAHPLALDSNGRFDEHHQRALTRYYAAAGAGGLAVGVHTTQVPLPAPPRGLSPDAVRHPRTSHRLFRAGTRAGARGNGSSRHCSAIMSARADWRRGW